MTRTLTSCLVPLFVLVTACTGFTHSTASATRTAAFPATWSEQPTRLATARRERLEAASRPREGVVGGLALPQPAPAPAVAPIAPAPVRRGSAVAPKYLPGSPQPAAYALIVGIERYRDAPPATGAAVDADRYAALATQTLGIPASHVHVLRDDRATGGDIDKEIGWLASNVPARGRVYFFFSGHGAPDPSNGGSYLVPYDGDPKALEPTAFAMPKLLERLSASRASEVFAVVDACFSGAGGRSVLPAGMRPLVAMREVRPTAKVALFTAASGAQTSGPSPDGDGGLFSKLVAEGIGSGKADIDGDGLVSIQELGTWVAPRVEREARIDRREQVPSMVIGDGLAEAGATPFAFVSTR
jgi:hypothetical protein